MAYSLGVSGTAAPSTLAWRAPRSSLTAPKESACVRRRSRRRCAATFARSSAAPNGSRRRSLSAPSPRPNTASSSAARAVRNRMGASTFPRMALAQLEPVHARHHDVEQDKVVALKAQPQRLFGAGDRLDVVAVLRKHAHEQGPDGRVVVDGEYMRHGRHLLSIFRHYAASRRSPVRRRGACCKSGRSYAPPRPPSKRFAAASARAAMASVATAQAAAIPA